MLSWIGRAARFCVEGAVVSIILPAAALACIHLGVFAWLNVGWLVEWALWLAVLAWPAVWWRNRKPRWKKP